MKKRYIDFVPAKGKTPARKVTAVKKPVAKPATKVAAKPVSKPAVRPVIKPVAKPAPKKISRREVPLEELFAERSTPKSVSKAKLGVIEDYNPAAKKPAPRTVAPKPVAPRAAAPKPVVKRPAYVAPKPVFLNTNKVVKRPLSNSTPPRRQPVIPEKEVAPTKPEKIITKPEKDSKAGLIIAIILTIILGAAAGTIAFLLLPK